MILNPKTTNIAELLQLAEEQLNSESNWVPILVALLYEYTNPASRWRPYLDFVDISKLDQPMFWGKDEVDFELHGTGIPESVEADMKSMKTEFEEIVLPFVKNNSEVFPNKCQEFELYKQMVAFVMAYSFTEPAREQDDSEDEATEDDDNKNSPSPVMVPLADILNSVPRYSACIQMKNNTLNMVTKTDCRKGCEVFNTYGELDNKGLLHMYGYSVMPSENPYNCARVPVHCFYEQVREGCEETPELLKLLDEKWSLLENVCGLSEDTSVDFSADGKILDSETETILKVLLMKDSPDLQEYKEKEEWTTDSEGDESGEYLTKKTVLGLENHQRELLRKVVNCCLLKYERSYEEDDQVYNDSAKLRMLTSRARYALYVRHSQRLLLKKLLSQLAN